MRRRRKRGGRHRLRGAEAPTTRTVRHAAGSSEVPVRPERIVVLDRSGTLPFLIELGLPPIASAAFLAAYGTDFPTVLGAAADGIGPVAVDADGLPNLEAVARLRPDLIVGSDESSIVDVYDELAVIAPTVVLNYVGNDRATTMRQLAAAIGLEAQAEQVIETFNRRLDDTRPVFAAARSVSVVLLYGAEQFQVRSDTIAPGSWFRHWGVPVTPTLDEAGGERFEDQATTLSVENLALIDGETIVALVNNPSSLPGGILPGELHQSPLPAVASGRVVVGDLQALFGTVGSLAAAVAAGPER